MTSLSPETGAELSEANIGSKIGSCIKKFKALTVSAIVCGSNFFFLGGGGGQREGVLKEGMMVVPGGGGVREGPLICISSYVGLSSVSTVHPPPPKKKNKKKKKIRNFMHTIFLEILATKKYPPFCSLTLR